MSDSRHACIACGLSSDEVPLILLDYRGATYRICPQDLPVLIQQPARLADRLPGLEQVKPATHSE